MATATAHDPPARARPLDLRVAFTRGALAVGSLGMLPTSGCGSYDALGGAAGARATRELLCPREQLHETHIYGGTYRLEGCGHVATYTCSMQSSLFFPPYTCLRESAEPSVATVPPSASVPPAPP